MKLKFVAAIILSISIFSNAQVKNHELSFSGTIGALKTDLEVTGQFSYDSEGSLNYYIMTNTRLGFFLNRNFEIEPELQFSIFQGRDPAYSLNANLLYNFDKDSSRVKPFLLLGYGIGNSVPLFNSLLLMDEQSQFVNQFNAGLGIKIFIAENIAIRTEYRFQLYKYKEELGNYFNPPVVHRYSYYMHNLLFGISFFI